MAEIIGKAVICALVAYFIGGINMAFFMAKLKGFDIRSKGTGNPGASNATIVMGKKAGVICALFDIFKAFTAVKLCGALFPDFPHAVIIAGACCVLGHIFPIYLKFKGGKGLAALGGMAMAYDLKWFLILLLIEVVIILIIDYICLIPTSGSIMFMILVGVQKGILFSLIFLPVVLIVCYRHIENFKKIRYGIEYRIRFLWKKEAEQQRVQANQAKLSEEQKHLFMKE
ncbi:MAG: glycerol-3-phosphate acyltransferase [Acetatifactor sp.]|nr:glycerol-3-phosphate acyltransferase [Acetatifactor sp.]